MPEATIAEPEIAKAAPPTPGHPGSISIDLGNLGKKAVKLDPAATPETPTPETDKASPDKTAGEKKPDDAAAAAKKPNDKEHNMAELRKAREAAEEARKAAETERDRIKAEFEALRTKAPEIPEDVKTRLSAVEKLEKEREELLRNLRQADLSRDPEFQEKYNKQITARIGAMGEAALAAGITQEDWKRAVANWNEEQFAEWSEAMSPIQRVKFTAAWTNAVELYQQQQQELSNADRTYQELQKQRQAEVETQQKQYFSQNENLARSILAEVLKPEGTREYEDLPAAAEAILMKAARHEIPAAEIFQQIAQNQVLARVTMKQKSQIDDLEKQIAERDKKIADQEAFIAQHAGSVPRGDATGSAAAADDKTPIWGRIAIKTS